MEISDELVTVASFTEPMEAHLCRQWLAAQGIETAIADANVSGTFWHYNLMTGGTKVQVPGSQAVEASQLLRDRQRRHDERHEQALAREAPPCPVCGGQATGGNASAIRWCGVLIIALLFGGAALLLAVPVVLYLLVRSRDRRRWCCRNCGHKWTTPRALDVPD